MVFRLVIFSKGQYSFCLCISVYRQAVSMVKQSADGVLAYHVTTAAWVLWGWRKNLRQGLNKADGCH